MSRRMRDLTGHRRGKLTVIRLLRKDTHGYVWLCHCTCGRDVELPACRASIRASCGSCRRLDPTGTTRGTWQVLEAAGRDRHEPTTWHCRCIRCGRECVLAHTDLVAARRRACGCIPRGRPRNTSLSKRDRAVVAARKKGLLFKTIAARFGLTRQRVQQIVRAAAEGRQGG